MSENQYPAGLRSYVVPYDSGFAPNPFHGFCTLATCKPRIRKGARVGDWIVGTGSKQNGLDGRLVYAMKVQEEMTFDEYFNDSRFQDKKPNPQGSREQQCGDNIYCRAGSDWDQLKSYHGEEDKAHDTKTDRVLISKDYVYFGREGPEIPKDIDSSGRWVCHEGRGHRKFDGSNPSDAEMIANFEEWIRSLGKTGVAGVPTDWHGVEDGSGCEGKKNQCKPEIERRKINEEELRKQQEQQRINGKKAEEFVLKFEQSRLNGKEGIQWIAPDDTGAGYDILSFQEENSENNDRYIEVKSYSDDRPRFFWTKNQIDVAEKYPKKYFIYLVNINKLDNSDYEPTIISNPVKNILGNNKDWEKEVDAYRITKK